MFTLKINKKKVNKFHRIEATFKQINNVFFFYLQMKFSLFTNAVLLAYKEQFFL